MQQFYTTENKCVEVTDYASGLVREVMRDLIHYFPKGEAVGLAAPQIGYDIRIALVKTKDLMDILVNPEILYQSSQVKTIQESCLSLPERYHAITRPTEIMIQYYSPLSESTKEKGLTGFTARVVQHEIDHLNGIMICDRASKSRGKKGFG